MPMIFPFAKGVANMVLGDVPFRENKAGISSECEATSERLWLQV